MASATKDREDSSKDRRTVRELARKLDESTDRLAKAASDLTKSYERIAQAAPQYYKKDFGSKLEDAAGRIKQEENSWNVAFVANRQIKAFQERVQEGRINQENVRDETRLTLNEVESKTKDVEGHIKKFNEVVGQSDLLAKRIAEESQGKGTKPGEKSTEDMAYDLNRSVKELDTYTMVGTYNLSKAQSLYARKSEDASENIRVGDIQGALAKLNSNTNKSLEAEVSGRSPVQLVEKKPVARVSADTPAKDQLAAGAERQQTPSSNEERQSLGAAAEQDALGGNGRASLGGKGEKDPGHKSNKGTRVDPIWSGVWIWGGSMEKYVKDIRKWGTTFDEEDEKKIEMIQKLMAQTKKSRSMEDATELWKEVNDLWLKKTDTLNEDAKQMFRQRSAGVDKTDMRSVESSMDMHREQLAFHFDHYREKMFNIAPGGGWVEKSLKDEERIRKEISAASGEEKKKKEAELRKLFEETQRRLDDSARRGDNRLVELYTHYRIMANAHNGGGSRGNYKGNDKSWQFIYDYAYAAWENGKLGDDAPAAASTERGKGMGFPPPPQSPFGSQGGQSGKVISILDGPSGGREKDDNYLPPPSPPEQKQRSEQAKIDMEAEIEKSALHLTSLRKGESVVLEFASARPEMQDATAAYMRVKPAPVTLEETKDIRRIRMVDYVELRIGTDAYRDVMENLERGNMALKITRESPNHTFQEVKYSVSVAVKEASEARREEPHMSDLGDAIAEMSRKARRLAPDDEQLLVHEGRASMDRINEALGKRVTIEYAKEGKMKTEQVFLTGLVKFDGIEVRGEKEGEIRSIKFADRGMAIKSISDGESPIYLNDKVKEGYNLVYRSDIFVANRVQFGSKAAANVIKRRRKEAGPGYGLRQE